MNMEKITIDVYKELICDMIAEIHDERFVKQVYAIIYEQIKRVGY